MILDAEMYIITAQELVQVTSSTPLVLDPFFPAQAFGVNSTENILFALDQTLIQGTWDHGSHIYMSHLPVQKQAFCILHPSLSVNE